MDKTALTMEESVDLKKMSVPLLVALCIVTLGLFYHVWFLSRRGAINKLHHKRNLGIAIFIFLLILWGLSVFLWLGDFPPVSRILSLFWAIGVIAQAFKVRRILMDHFRIRIDEIATFFLTIFYLQWEINRL